MITFIEAINSMHTRGVVIDEKDYIFTLMVVLGSEPQEAYCIAYCPSDLNKALGSEDEDVFISSKKKESETLLEQQHIKQLKDLIEESYRSEIQKKALNLDDFSFSGKEAVQILNNLLKSRVEDIDSASVKDVVSVIKQLTEQGALDTGDGGFSKHFVVVKDKFNALCTSCNREMDAFKGIGCKCPHCGQKYVWSNEEERFYPEVGRL